jgi:hypothetical protein
MDRRTTTTNAGRAPPPVRWTGRKAPSRIQHPELTRRAAERAVTEVWEQHIWPPFRPFIAARLDRIRLTAGRQAGYRHRGRQLSLAVPYWKPTEDWALDIRYAVGTLMAYALLLEVAALAAGADSQTGSLPRYRQGACSAEWIAKQLGHTSTQMLFRRYAKFIPNVTRRDGSAFLEAYRGWQVGQGRGDAGQGASEA